VAFLRFLRALIIITIALAGGAILFGLILFATSWLTVMETMPADYLPSEQTVALFTNPSQEDIRLFEAFLPPLSAIEEPDGDVAVLRIEDDLVPVLFSDRRGREEFELVLGRFEVSVSDPRAHLLLSSDPPRLKDSAAYQALTRQQHPGSSWVFADITLFPPPASLPEELLSLLPPPQTTHGAFTREEGRTHLAWYGLERPVKQGLPSRMRNTIPDIVGIIRVNDLPALWSAAEESLTQPTKSFLMGTLTQMAHDSFGEIVSLRSDLLPLFAGPTTIIVGQSASGTTIALESVGSSLQQLDEGFALLHRAFHSASPRTRITERILSDRFSARDIRIEEETTSTEEDVKLQHWNVRRTLRSNGEEFVTAQLGGTFLMANSLEMLTQMLRKDVDINPPTGSQLIPGIRLADGLLDIQALKTLLEEKAPFLLEERLPSILGRPSGSLLWSVEQRKNVTTLTIEMIEEDS